jgi:hypothetical protein
LVIDAAPPLPLPLMKPVSAPSGFQNEDKLIFKSRSAC